ncbi:hypothetical protein VA7868_00341 [Vibrio aerogenes CECT 7868]|uniref:Uncharacterized protein n=1 Tax=Vibrio aerogenes CECT 7868 TaxID=1216006 RepID=A0A1M5VCK6_9VIBR|nr:hypothetical protein VA7868_00341 [Vibrio aerogenes CECT 7868]
MIYTSAVLLLVFYFYWCFTFADALLLMVLW